MPYLKVNGKEIELDKDGFPARQEDWSKGMGRAAKTGGIPISAFQ